MRSLFVLSCLILSGCGTTLDLTSTSPYQHWIGNSYPAATEITLCNQLFGHSPGGISYRLTPFPHNNEEHLATYPTGTEFLVTGVEIRKPLIGVPTVYIQVEVPRDDSMISADVLLLDEPYPLVLDWPNQRLQLTGDARE